MGKKKMDSETRKEVHDPAEIVKMLEDYKEKAEPFPMIAAFCDKYKISRSTLYFLKKKHEEVAVAMDFLLCKKETIITYGAATGKINPQFAQFLLKNQCGYYGDESNDKNSDNRPIINITIPKELKE